MKRYLILFLFTIIAAFSFGQSDYQDVVYLKNGSIIRGVIIEVVPNKSLKIEAADGKVFICQFDEIEKYTKEPYEGKPGSSKNSTGLQSGFKAIVEIGPQIGVGEDKIDKLMLNLIYGYQVNPNFSIGIGTGFRYYFEVEEVLMPVFVDFRTYFVDSKVSPYLSIGAGYSFNGTPVGLFINPTLGVSFKVFEKSAMNIGLGYEIQYGYFCCYYDDDWYEICPDLLGAISITMGISF